MNPAKWAKALVPIALVALYTIQQLISDGSLDSADIRLITAAVLTAVITYLTPNKKDAPPIAPLGDLTH